MSHYYYHKTFTSNTQQQGKRIILLSMHFRQSRSLILPIRFMRSIRILKTDKSTVQRTLRVNIIVLFPHMIQFVSTAGGVSFLLQRQPSFK
jgi:hypothetical protein